MKISGRILQVLILLILFNGAAFAQTDKKTKKIADTKALVDSRRFVFIAQTAQPMNGLSIQLTSQYDLQLRQDTLEAYLPYFGRAYTATIDPSKAGIRFKSTKFDYTNKAGRKEGWTITMTPKDVTDSDVRQLNLSISDEGYSTLQVTGTNRQPISFNGYIDAIKPRKKN